MIKSSNCEVIKLSEVLQAKIHNKLTFIEEFNRQTAELSDIPGTLENEQRTLNSRLVEQNELDARFAAIIEMIRETRKMLEQTMTRNFEPKSSCLSESGE